MLATIDKLGGRTVVVIVDLITDEYLFGKPVRISREAPVLILTFSEREELLGGAAHAANNVHALRAPELQTRAVRGRNLDLDHHGAERPDAGRCVRRTPQQRSADHT